MSQLRRGPYPKPDSKSRTGHWSQLALVRWFTLLFLTMQDTLKIIAAVLLVLLVIFGIGSCKYHFWRAEHPQAATWTFFIPSGR